MTDTPNLGVSSNTDAGGRFVIASGSQTAIPAGSGVNAIDYVNLASTGNALDFGDTISSGTENCGCASATRGVYFTISTNIFEYVTISSTGNAQDFGDNTLWWWWNWCNETMYVYIKLNQRFSCRWV